MTEIRKKKKEEAHILVTTGNGDVPVVPLSRHDSLDAVRDKVSRLQAEAHSAGAHRNGVADADRVKPEPHHARLLNALLHRLRKPQQVHVTGVPLVPDGGDPNLGLRQVVIGEPHSVEDRLGATLGLGLCYAGAILVQLDSGGLLC